MFTNVIRKLSAAFAPAVGKLPPITGERHGGGHERKHGQLIVGQTDPRQGQAEIIATLEMRIGVLSMGGERLDTRTPRPSSC